MSVAVLTGASIATQAIQIPRTTPTIARAVGSMSLTVTAFATSFSAMVMIFFIRSILTTSALSIIAAPAEMSRGLTAHAMFSAGPRKGKEATLQISAPVRNITMKKGWLLFTTCSLDLAITKAMFTSVYTMQRALTMMTPMAIPESMGM